MIPTYCEERGFGVLPLGTCELKVACLAVWHGGNVKVERFLYYCNMHWGKAVAEFPFYVYRIELSEVQDAT